MTSADCLECGSRARQASSRNDGKVLFGRKDLLCRVGFGSAVPIGNTIGSGILRNPGEVTGRLPSIGLFLNVRKIRVDSDNKR
jgi:hypothetical protein